MDIKDLIENILDTANKNNYSDIHIVSSKKPYARNRLGEIVSIDYFIKGDIDCSKLADKDKETPKQEKILEDKRDKNPVDTPKDSTLDSLYVIPNSSEKQSDIDIFMKGIGEESNSEDMDQSFEKIEAPIISKDMVKNIIIDLVGYNGMDKFFEEKELDASFEFKNGERYRINCYEDSSGYAIALRVISSEIPTLDDLGFPSQIVDLIKKPKGLILVTGPTGSGKSTSLAAMIEFINQNYKKHIITIEDPIEFVIKSKKSLINQREIGTNTIGFDRAMKSALRGDPDIIMVGEMRDPETIKAVLTLAETGHLVLSSLHTNDTVQSIDRIIDVFTSSAQKQIRMQLALSLVGIISQKLIPKIDGVSKIAGREILINTDAVRNLIITGKSHQIYSVIEVSSNSGMILMDRYLQILYEQGHISKEMLFSYARDTDGLKLMIK